MSTHDAQSSLTAAADAGDIRAQYQLGMDALQRQHFPVAERWLRRAAEARSPDAQNALATMYLYGMGNKVDVQRAAALYEAAAAVGHVDARFTLANLHFIGIMAGHDDKRALRLLKAAAEGHCSGALRVLGFIHARQSESRESQRLATGCFVASAAAGDALAMHIAGLRYLYGRGVSENQGHARYWFGKAADIGIPLSQRRFTALGGVGSEVSPDPSPPGIDGAPNFDWPVCKFETINTISDKARIGFVDNVLTVEECEYLIMLAEPRLSASLTLDPSTGKMLSSTLRTSRSMNFDPVTKDIVLHLAERRLAALAQMPVDHAEPLAVLHYRKNEEYRPHYDYFVAEAMVREPRLKVSGQRLVTTFVYLSDVDRGGGTDFPRLMKTVEPRQGRALLMHNCDPQGQPDSNTLHAGLPVIAGEKWLVTLWFRERPFVPT